MLSPRNVLLLDGLSPSDLGMEIAPWFAPVAPRKAGYNVRILDVFDTETLRARGRADASLDGFDMETLDAVDFVGSATEIATLVPEAEHATFDYIVSAHNFEHLANPIKFLRGCEILLKPGGVLSMAVPDMRACFDFFRPPTVIGDWIEAFLADRDRPTPRQVFDHESHVAKLRAAGGDQHAFALAAPLDLLELVGDLHAAHADWTDGAADPGYRDAHCTVMTPASLHLMLVEAKALGLVPLVVDRLTETVGCEFTVRLRKPRIGEAAPVEAGPLSQTRRALMIQALKERAVPMFGLDLGKAILAAHVAAAPTDLSLAMAEHKKGRSEFRQLLSDLNAVRKRARKRRRDRAG